MAVGLKAFITWHEDINHELSFSSDLFGSDFIRNSVAVLEEKKGLLYSGLL